MKYLKCYYDPADTSGISWDTSIRLALSGYSAEERRKIQVLCLPKRNETIIRRRAGQVEKAE